MTIAEILAESTLPPLERELLLAYVLQQERPWLVAHAESRVEQRSVEAYRALVQRRHRHEPIAYILGTKEFYGRDFIVNEHVLIPRPATEGLIDLVLDFLETQETCVRAVDAGIVCLARRRGELEDVQTIVDVGTGSGCIAVTLACELPQHHVFATDVSRGALDVAQHNAVQHAVADRLTFLHGEGLTPVSDVTDPFLLVSNPPYIPAGAPLPADVAEFEPAQALYAGEDGLDVLTSLVVAAHAHPHCRGYVLECRREQASALLV